MLPNDPRMIGGKTEEFNCTPSTQCSCVLYKWKEGNHLRWLLHRGEMVCVSFSAWAYFMDRIDNKKRWIPSVRYWTLYYFLYLWWFMHAQWTMPFPAHSATKGEEERKWDLLECLWEEEALLHVIVADCHGVNVSDPREARLYSAVFLKGLTGDTHRGFVWTR